MSYASLVEIWPGFVASDKFKKMTNTLPNNYKRLISMNTDFDDTTSYNRGGNASDGIKKVVEPVFYEKSREYPLRKDKGIEKFTNMSAISEGNKYAGECSIILQHLSKCQKCRAYFQQKFTPQHEQEPEPEETDEYLDLAIYIVTGIFILFALDILIKFNR